MNKQELARKFGEFFWLNEQDCKELEKLPVELLRVMYNTLNEELSF